MFLCIIHGLLQTIIHSPGWWRIVLRPPENTENWLANYLEGKILKNDEKTLLALLVVVRILERFCLLAVYFDF